MATGKRRRSGADTADTSRTSYMQILEKGVSPITVTLPVAYLKVLSAEANFLGSKRSGFLEQLLRRSAGQLTFERPANAPNHTVTDEDLQATKKWAWYLKTELRAVLDTDRHQKGLAQLPISAWIIVTINQWLGRPAGLQIERNPPRPA